MLAAHECPTVPVWRPTTRDEIQPGWEIRSRYYDGREARWGTAHHRGVVDGDWYAETGAMLTWDDMSWTYETIAPIPEPKPDPRAERFAKAMYLAFTDKSWEEISDENRVSYLRDGAEVLRFYDALTEGEQS